MATTYLEQVVSEKKFQGNVVIRIAGNYFAFRNPDSGLSITSPFDRSLSSLVLNPTSIDPRRVSTTIASYSFKIVDKSNVLTALMEGDANPFMQKEVEVWLGRSGVDMPFSNYYKLPITRVSKVDHSDNGYSFTSSEETKRMDRAIYTAETALAVDILTNTTVIQMRDDISDFPESGFLKIEDEFISYSSKNDLTKQISGAIRGEYNSVPVKHESNSEVFHAEKIQGNPVDILLRILISGGGAGTYDTLQSGLGIDLNLIDIAEITALRDEFFLGQEYELVLYDIDSALKFLERELLMPCNLRFRYSRNSLISLAILDRAVFVEQQDVINEDSITKFPKWSVDGDKINNVIEVQWDFDEGSNLFRNRSVFRDEASIAEYGEQQSIKYSFKGIQADLDGQAIVEDFATNLLRRLSVPTPEVQINTHVDKSLQTIGDKTLLESRQIPSSNGTLNFGSEMEIISRSFNFITGDVQFKLAFTSFTGIRSCYLSPSSTIMGVLNQKTFTLPAGRGDLYSVSWVMRLFRNVPHDYTSDAPNKIASISGDTITMVDNFTTPLVPGEFKLKFADYDEVVETQKSYCFISEQAENFSDGKPTYRITY